jgi:hypothetical protein
MCAIDANVDVKSRIVEITLEDGQKYRCSLAEASESLRLADPSLLKEWEWIGPKAGMHWPSVDEDLSIEYLVANGQHSKPVDKVSLQSA